jgi:hypothetical protein
MLDAALVQYPRTVAAVEADGALAPLPGRPQLGGSLWVCCGLPQHQKAQCLKRTGNYAHVVVPQSSNKNGIPRPHNPFEAPKEPTLFAWPQSQISSKPWKERIMGHHREGHSSSIRP